ncbi:MAG: UDP-N-acetylglucosamine 1-carboxyvinyltransferase [Candidatus Marinimicrobia bacterium]|nr:UDP-N-acetylglucosamine 1-carboxyvinyltransferase [Candidatus Neomarinimicrobiota bacterium]|tara:strand:- start:14115 stop:15371 length:1257 start_codon:yes stop_codon:yes gene_type:complete
MDKIIIQGKSNLNGFINVHGAKNAALPILVSSLLTNKNLIIKNLPNVGDIQNMIKLLNIFGTIVNKEKDYIILNSKNIKNISADYDIIRKMRASILILGPLLSRFGSAKISLPGGCAIGTRPIDIHLEGLKKLGASFEIENGFVIGKVSNSLIGNKINFPFPSVGATENILMSAVLAKGETLIENAAREPEIVDLAKSLKKMGAKINGEGSNKIIIQGVDSLEEGNHHVISDRIVAGTYIIAAIMLNSNFEVRNFNPHHLSSLINILKSMGSNLEIKNNSVLISKAKNIKSIHVETLPYPGFPTDLQAQLMALMCLADGDSTIRETVFENRFMHVSELNRLGASIRVEKDIAYIKGNQKFKGAQVMASDLRASVSLVLAALSAVGTTVINRVYHLDRGYEKIEETLGKLGPDIKREKN